MEGNPLISLLEKVEVDKEKFTQLIMPKVQECILELLRPSDTQMLIWKNVKNGRKDFEKFILSKFEILPDGKTIGILWDYYSGKKIKQRDRKVINNFIEINCHKKECAHCKIDTGCFHVDHIVPLAKGGTDEMWNLQFLCEQCNLDKGAKLDCKIKII